ncbi:hypothetical protein DYB35_012324, partial [Aphanomyces astaci]
MERGIYRKNINEDGRQQQNPPPNGFPRGGRNQNQRGGRAGRGGRGRGNNRQDHANNAAEDIFFLNEGGSDEEIGSEVKIDMLNLNEDTNHNGEEQMTIIDSGASSHMTGYCNMLFDIEECQRQVRLTNHQRIDVDKMGKFKIKNPNGSTCVFTNVLYVPTLHHTLFKGKTCSIKVGDRVSAEAKLNDRRMYQLTGKIEAAPDDIACLATDGATWHQRLGHPSIASTKEIIAATKDGPKQAMEPQKCDDFDVAFQEDTFMNAPRDHDEDDNVQLSREDAAMEQAMPTTPNPRQAPVTEPDEPSEECNLADIDDPEPTNFWEAMKTDESDEWLAACKSLGEAIEINDLGPVKRILGIDVYRDPRQGTTTLSQESYIAKVAQRFKLTGTDLDQDATPLPSNKEYQALVGSLLYCSTKTR